LCHSRARARVQSVDGRANVRALGAVLSPRTWALFLAARWESNGPATSFYGGGELPGRREGARPTAARRPASSRNPGQLRVVIPGRNKLESASPMFAAHARKASGGPIWLKGRKIHPIIQMLRPESLCISKASRGFLIPPFLGSNPGAPATQCRLGAVVSLRWRTHDDGALWFVEQLANKIGRLSLPALQVSPATNIAASGTQGQAFSPTSFSYQLSATSGSLNYSISGIPAWLIANFTSGTATTLPVTVTFSLTNLGGLTPNTYAATITFTNTSTGNGNTTRTATLTVNPGTKDGCNGGGWQNYISFPGPFKNQGQCVSYFANQ
jgi:hypothetical protein